MDDPFGSLRLLLSDVILPNLKSMQENQAEQIAANDRLEYAIDELRTHIELQFAKLAAQLTACQAELAATQAALKTAEAAAEIQSVKNKVLIH
jgi:hypothetical protein